MQKNQTNSPKTHMLFVVATATTALLQGGLIYILYRPQLAEFFNWTKALGFDGQLQQLRNLQFLKQAKLPNWFVYSFPNFLWAFAYSLIIIKTWWFSTARIKYFWFITIPLFTFGFELLQLTPVIKGTFCKYDLLACLGGIVLSIIIQPKKQ